MTTSLFRWLSLALFVILIYCSFLSASYVTSTMDEISVGIGVYAPMLTGLLAVGVLAVAARAARSEVQRSWYLLLLGIGMWVVADFIWGAQEIWNITETSYFTFADLLWVVGYGPIGASIWSYLSRLGKVRFARLRKLILLAAICILPLAVFVVNLRSMVISPLLQEEGWIVLFPTVYPILDMILAAGGLLVATSSRHRFSNWHWMLIGIALVIWSYSDVFYAIASINDWYETSILIRLGIDLTYTLAYLILATGAALSLQKDTFSYSEE